MSVVSNKQTGEEERLAHQNQTDLTRPAAAEQRRETRPKADFQGVWSGVSGADWLAEVEHEPPAQAA